MLTPEQQAIMVIVALNHLPTLRDHLNPDLLAEGCCPDCCASCDVLRELDRTDLLNQVIEQAPADMQAERYAWARDGAVDIVWLYAVWDCTSRPKCADDTYPDFNLDYVAETTARQLDITVPTAYQLLEMRLAYEQALYEDDGTPPVECMGVTELDAGGPGTVGECGHSEVHPAHPIVAELKPAGPQL